jgi:alpha-glucosidase
MLSLYRRMLAFRRGSDALRRGSFVRVPVHGNALAYLRDAPGDRAFAAVNFGGERVEVAVPAGTVAVATSRRREGDRVDGSCTLEGNEALVVSLD